MSEAIQLTIVTDHADRACRLLFGFSLRTAAIEAPWCRFVDRAADIFDIATGAAVMAIWTGSRKVPGTRITPRGEAVAIEEQWRVERRVRPFDDDHARHAARIDHWLARRAAREAELIAIGAAEAGFLPPSDATEQAPETVLLPHPASLPPAGPATVAQPRTMWS